MSKENLTALADRVDTLTGELDMVTAGLSLIWHAVDDDHMTKEVIVNALGGTIAHLERLDSNYSDVCSKLLKMSCEADRVN